MKTARARLLSSLALAGAAAASILLAPSEAQANGRFPESNAYFFSPSDPNTVILRVTDNTGATATASRSVTVAASSSQGPTAAFTISPTPAIINQDVVFDASTSRAQGGFSIAWYRWNFGDSNQTFTCPGDARCGALNPAVFTYRYTRTGTFTVTLTVMDGNSREATVSRTIQVQ